MRRTFLSFGIAALSLSLASVGAQAQQLNGSLPLAGIGVMQDGANLSLSTTVIDAFAVTTGAGAGDYAAIPFFTTFTTTPLALATPTTFSFSNAVYGSFMATSDVVLTHTASNYDVELFGTYTPGPGLSGFVATPGEVRVSINQSGASLSQAITLSTPAAVPEPGRVALLAGMGLSGVGFLARRRKNALTVA